jgi:putative ABC transport system ATP-binding protein
MNPSLFRYIWQQTRREQGWILFVILASMPFNYVMLDLPKYIVNGPIQARGFESENATQHYFQIRIPVPAGLSDSGFVELLHGFDLNRVSSLVILSALFLLLVIINGLFKFYINTYKGRLGERMLQQLRYDLIDRVLRFPPSEFRRVKPAEIATMIKDEVEPLGGFIGDAYVQPVFLGGQIVTSIVFILLQNFMLGLIAVSLLLVQGIVIPRMRRRQLVLGRQRQLTSRALAGRIGEIIDDIASVHTNDTSNWQRAEIANRLTSIFAIRFALYQWKFFVKFLNNLLAQLTPFLFYMVGGFLAIMGHLNIGQLVAVISAYKDLPSPVKDLIDWDQQRLDVEVKYNQVIEQFSLDDTVEMLPPPDFEGPVPHLTGTLALAGVTVNDSTGARLLDNFSFSMDVHEKVAIDGSATGGGETLIEVVARLALPAGGHVTLGGRELRDWPLAVTGRRISTVVADTYFPQSDIREALLYGLRHAPNSPSNTMQRHRIIKGRGNSLDVDADWIDYEAAGASGPDDIGEALSRVLIVVDLEADVVSFGFGRQLPSHPPGVETRFVQSRATFRERLAAAELLHLVEPFDPTRYHVQSSIAENLIFGTPVDPSVSVRVLATHPILRRVLEEQRLDADLFDMGREIATTILDVFQGLEPDNPLFEQLSLMGPEQFPDFQAALKRVGTKTFAQARPGDQTTFVDLAMSYSEARDRLGLLDRARMDRLLEARHIFHDRLGDDQQEIAFWDPGTYNPAASVKDNILMGRVAHGVAEADTRVNAIVQSIIDDLGLRPMVFEAGLAFNIGSGGKRLSAVQRQKLALARALLRRPDLLLAHRPLQQIDARGQHAILSRVMAMANGQDGPGFGVLWALENPAFVELFPRTIRLEHGRVVDDRIGAAEKGQEATATVPIPLRISA